MAAVGILICFLPLVEGSHLQTIVGTETEVYQSTQQTYSWANPTGSKVASVSADIDAPRKTPISQVATVKQELDMVESSCLWESLGAELGTNTRFVGFVIQ